MTLETETKQYIFGRIMRAPAPVAEKLKSRHATFKNVRGAIIMPDTLIGYAGKIHIVSSLSQTAPLYNGGVNETNVSVNVTSRSVGSLYFADVPFDGTIEQAGDFEHDTYDSGTKAILEWRINNTGSKSICFDDYWAIFLNKEHAVKYASKKLIQECQKSG